MRHYLFCWKIKFLASNAAAFEMKFNFENFRLQLPSFHKSINHYITLHIWLYALPFPVSEFFSFLSHFDFACCQFFLRLRTRGKTDKLSTLPTLEKITASSFQQALTVTFSLASNGAKTLPYRQNTAYFVSCQTGPRCGS